jgi:hypothetical protein
MINRELSELAKTHGYSEDVQKLMGLYPVIQVSAVRHAIKNHVSERDLVICVFSSCNVDGPVIITDDHDKELKEYYDGVHKEAVAKYERHSRDGKFVFTSPFPIN